jgi:hypothetical protein
MTPILCWIHFFAFINALAWPIVAFWFLYEYRKLIKEYEQLTKKPSLLVYGKNEIDDNIQPTLVFSTKSWKEALERPTGFIHKFVVLESSGEILYHFTVPPTELKIFTPEEETTPT